MIFQLKIYPKRPKRQHGNFDSEQKNICQKWSRAGEIWAMFTRYLVDDIKVPDPLQESEEDPLLELLGQLLGATVTGGSSTGALPAGGCWLPPGG